MLRAFDLNYAYGPCVGINRIDRWGNFYFVVFSNWQDSYNNSLYTDCRTSKGTWIESTAND